MVVFFKVVYVLLKYLLSKHPVHIDKFFINRSLFGFCNVVTLCFIKRMILFLIHVSLDFLFPSKSSFITIL